MSAPSAAASSSAASASAAAAAPDDEQLPPLEHPHINTYAEQTRQQQQHATSAKRGVKRERAAGIEAESEADGAIAASAAAAVDDNGNAMEFDDEKDGDDRDSESDSASASDGPSSEDLDDLDDFSGGRGKRGGRAASKPIGKIKDVNGIATAQYPKIQSEENDTCTEQISPSALLLSSACLSSSHVLVLLVLFMLLFVMLCFRGLHASAYLGRAIGEAGVKRIAQQATNAMHKPVRHQANTSAFQSMSEYCM